MLYDRRPLLAWTCDKLRMKEEAARCAVATPRTCWWGSDLHTLVGVDLPANWVLKPNHRSGMVTFGQGPVTAADMPRLKALTDSWLSDTRSMDKGEWAYSQARPCLLVEEMLGGGDTSPADYKFFVFDGKPLLIQVDTDRFQGHQRRLYTPAWEPLPDRNMFKVAPVMEPPQRLDQMLAAASCLGEPFDFIRVDLYNVDSAIFLGELTPYPGGGLEIYQPRDLDLAMGAAWQLPKL